MYVQSEYPIQLTNVDLVWKPCQRVPPKIQQNKDCRYCAKPHFSPRTEINSWSGCDRGRAGRTMYTGWYAKKSTRCGGSLSLTVCTHVECVPAQLQRQPSAAAAAAAAGNLKPVFYLKDGGGGGGKADPLTVDKDHWNGPQRERERERERARARERDEGGKGGRLSNLVWRWIIIRAASRLPPHVTAELVCEAV